MNIPNRILCCKTRFVNHAYTIRDNVVFRDGNLLVVIHVRDGNYENREHRGSALPFLDNSNLSVRSLNCLC